MTATVRNLSVCIGVIVSLSLFGCAGIETSKYSYSESYKANEPVKAEGCYDASVLLAKNATETLEIATKVLAAVDSTISEKTDSQIKAQRNRHFGLFIGSGGEELFITIRTAPRGQTFVAVATKTGFVGGAGQKAWSCHIVDQMITLASR